jgi:transposase
MQSLRDQPGSDRKTRLTKSQLTQIEKVVKAAHHKAGMRGQHWNGSILAEYIHKKMGVELKIRQCQRMFQKLGVAGPSGRQISR